MLTAAMWSNLRKLLADQLGKRAKRRAAPPRLRGQFEPLESRTVLSATIGMMAIDFDANTVTIAVWQSPAPPSAGLPWALVHDAPPLASSLPSGGWHPGGDERAFFQGTTGALDGGYVDASSIPGKPPLRATASQSDSSPVRATAPAEPDATAGALNFNADPGPAGGFVNSAFTRYRAARTLLNDALAYTAATPASSTLASPLSISPSLSTNDAAFDRLVDDDLLLTAATDSRDGKSPDDQFANSLSPDDDQKSTTDAGESFAAEEVAASLDALHRERKAIDEVLAGLHDVAPREKTQGDAIDNRQHSPADSRVLTHERHSAEQRAERPAEYTPTDGMVLLQPTGDANKSAYDLADVYFARLGGDDHAPLAVEASLGMYQAIDVGEQSAASRVQVPVAQPGQTRPSVSAENAPVKKSEQPT